MSETKETEKEAISDIKPEDLYVVRKDKETKL